VKENERIQFLDGLRCVAVLAVVLYHYFTRWTQPLYAQNLYPYGNLLKTPFQYGHFGVQLFFIISGFVITLTLYRCSTFVEFAVRRFARLWPTMAVSCLLTFMVVHFIPNRAFLVSAYSWLPSLTFCDPGLYNKLFHTNRFDWIDGVYWSLFVEVRFYFLAGVIFFLRRDTFPQCMFLFGITVCGLRVVSLVLHAAYFGGILTIFLIADFLPWFLMGIAFFFIHKRAEPKLSIALLLLGLTALMARAVYDRSILETLSGLLIPALFFATFRIALLNRLVSIPSLAGVGAASYSLYLIHQNLGVALIDWLGALLHLAGFRSLVLPIVVLAVVTLFAKFIYQWWESPLNRQIVMAVTCPLFLNHS
jgi:peptidoglycan/LPS O-acetylase OafA/YrhL